MPPSSTDPLHQNLLEAHRLHDHPALITLYTQAADTADTNEACGFFLTHAYVFALDQGDPRAAPLKARLVAMGREKQDEDQTPTT